ncbi:hypothetical protein PNEG_03404 [Pneumocystis murina B123]|uniref:Vacuolar protein sorting-associated protein 27 n=1 Tax=Pneumocystis murina (strain B123) TaxID=1069680 RepID=M7NM73_PNEMU|nr:hypothetical protein PNEG_03404 [Pneumocystis murina B123]EMR08236.1 hypothetical protein PNEG_03404 [Pneumocystis murina B123]
MLSWWTFRAFDELVEKATSEDIPAGIEDLTSCLEICDKIRSKSVPSKDAMRSLKRRMAHKSANVQILTLKLIDLCVKNGGDHFLLEISSREFMDNLVSLLKTNKTTEHDVTAKADVRKKILELIQVWAVLFEKKKHLGYVCTVYEDLQSQGYEFPPKEPLNSTFIDSFSPPEWSDSSICMLCRTRFTFKNRKHHCRNCGGTFCQSCSSKSRPLLYIGIIEPARVCDNCYSKKTQTPAISMPNNVLDMENPKNTNIDDDSDLKYAIKLSLEESKLQESKFQQDFPKDHKRQYSDDEDLKKAISLSLKESEQSKSVSFTPNVKTIVPDLQPKFEHELTALEIENINTFCMLIQKLQMAPIGSILRDHYVQELHDSVIKLKPKLIRSLGNTISKYEKLIDIHSKLSTVMKYYDKLLEDRLSTAYSRHHVSSIHEKSSLHPFNQTYDPSLLTPTSSMPSEYYSHYKELRQQKNTSFYSSYIPSQHASSTSISPSKEIISSTIPNYSSNTFSQDTFTNKPSSTFIKDSCSPIHDQHNPNHSSLHQKNPLQDKTEPSTQVSLIDL